MQRLNVVRQKHPGYEIAVTGLSAIAARNSANMIEKLNRGLTIEFALVAVFIGLAFRSWVVMFACILPGIFRWCFPARCCTRWERGCNSQAWLR